jgi:PAS domain S-box-containing protein
VVNRPLSFWERYQQVLEPVIVLVGALIVAIFLLAEASLRLLEYREAERNGRLLSEALRDSAAGLNSTLSLEQVLDRILVSVSQILPHDAANLMLIDLPGTDVHLERARGYERLGPEYQEIVLKLNLSMDQFKNLQIMYYTGEPYITPDTQSDPDWMVLPVSAWVKSYIGAPVIIGGQVVGFVNLDSATPGRFSQDDARILTIFADQAAAAIHNAQLFEQAQQEIAERQRTEALLRDSEERFRLAFQTSPDAISISHLESGGFVEVNDFYCRLSGYSRQELLGKTGLELNLWAEPSQRRELLQILAQRGSVENVELSGLRKDGSVVSLLASACTLQLYGAPHLLMISRDITERKQAEAERMELERRLLHAQKLESLGVLAGGIAHDFNNLLLAMLGNLELAQEKLPAGDRARLSVEQAIHAAQRAADLTRQLLAYSGRGQFIVHPLDLSRLVEENVHLFRAVLSKSTSLSLALYSPLPAVLADAAQMQQVVMNLLTNAAEALQDGKGEITLSTGVQDCTLDDMAHSRLDERPPAGRFVFLQVMDTGVGMDAEALSRLFEPFFTTKVAGRGLGMSAVLGIVRGHQGAIFVDSTPGRGTCVRVLFPACDAPVQEPGPSLTPAAARPTEAAQKPLKGCVLVVDDERIVRQVCTDLLEFFGFSVITADDGQAGVDALQAYAGQVDLVLLDLSMPRLDGLEAFHLMREIAPQVPVVLSSGYDEKDALRQFAGEGLAGFIQKPYTMDNLRSKVAQAIQPRS